MEIISYSQLVVNEGGKQIQRGMNFGIQKSYSIVLMSTFPSNKGFALKIAFR